MFIYLFLREKEREKAQAGQAQRERESRGDRIPRKLHAVSADADVGLEFMNHEIIT